MTRSDDFLALHVPGSPLLLPNPWDRGSARLLVAMGFRALATTSAGYAGALGRVDGTVTLESALAHTASIVAAVDVPVSADFENGYADSPADVEANVRRAGATGLAGISVEDWDPVAERTYPVELATERVAGAAASAHDPSQPMVLTARADQHFHGASGPEALEDTIRRLQAYEEAGADVLYAPGVNDKDGIRRIVEAVGRPVNVLAAPGTPPVARLADLGVARISTGSGLFWAALGGLTKAASELLDVGTYGYWATVGRARSLADEAFEETRE